MAEIRSKYIEARALRRQPVSREEYTLSSLERTFPTGHWVQQAADSTAPENYEQPLYVTVIGGQKYDKKLVHRRMPISDYNTKIVVGAGRGVESDLPKEYQDVVVVPVDQDRYGKNARKVNVEQVLSFAPTSPLLLVGNGERVKAARAWLKRANWGREVIELP